MTRGLDPGVLMKDSGVNWLREILAHWTARGVELPGVEGVIGKEIEAAMDEDTLEELEEVEVL